MMVHEGLELQIKLLLLNYTQDLTRIEQKFVAFGLAALMTLHWTDSCIVSC